MDLSLGLSGSHVMVTAVAEHIGRVVVNAFLAAGALVSAFDIEECELSSFANENLQFSRSSFDVTDEVAVEDAFCRARLKFGPNLDVCRG